MLCPSGRPWSPAVAGAALATLLKLPEGTLLGAMIGVAVVKLTSDLTFQIPSAGRWIVYCLVGWLLGQTVTRESVAVLKSHPALILVVVSLFLVFGLALAWFLWGFNGLDVDTALLATAPGGIAQIGVLSAEAKLNVPLILSIHVLRVVSVIVLTSVGLKLMGQGGPGGPAATGPPSRPAAGNLGGKSERPGPDVRSWPEPGVPRRTGRRAPASSAPAR